MIKCGTPPYLECSSKGFKPFSAFYAKVNGFSIEKLYQAKKVFDDGRTGLSWQEAKGKQAVNQEECAIYYENLWRMYLDRNPDLVKVLLENTGFSDIFGQEGHVCQALTLYKLREEYLHKCLHQNYETICDEGDYEHLKCTDCGYSWWVEIPQ